MKESIKDFAVTVAASIAAAGATIFLLVCGALIAISATLGSVAMFASIPAGLVWIVWTHFGLGVSLVGPEAQYAALTFWQCFGICFVLSIFGGFFRSTKTVIKEKSK